MPTGSQRGLSLPNPLLPFILGCFALDLNFGGGGEFRFANVIVCGAAALAAALAIYGQRQAYSKWMPILPDYIYLAYLAWVALSAIWSVSPSDTLVQLSMLVVIWVAATTISGQDITIFNRYIVNISMVIAVLSLVAAVVAPSYAYQPKASGDFPELRGIVLHQLRLGLNEGIAFGLLVFAWLNGEARSIVRSKIAFWIIAGTIAICALLAFARLYTAFLILSFVFCFLMSKHGFIRWISIISIMAVISLVLANQEFILGQLEANGVDTGLTGRTLLWSRTLSLAESHPIIGYGYATFNDPGFLWMWRGDYIPPHPHNSYIQAYMETGIIGLLLTIALVISHLITSLRFGTIRRKYSYSLFLVLVCLLGSLTGANYAAKPSLLFAFTILAVGIEARAGRFATRMSRQAPLDLQRRSEASVIELLNDTRRDSESPPRGRRK